MTLSKCGFQDTPGLKNANFILEQNKKLKNLCLPFLVQKSSLGENWPVGSGRSSSRGDHHHHHSSDASGMKYVVYKQPLSLDRFFIHEVAPHEAALSKLENAFILVCLNRFQQIVTVHTFQAETEQLKVRYTIYTLSSVE